MKITIIIVLVLFALPAGADDFPRSVSEQLAFARLQTSFILKAFALCCLFVLSVVPLARVVEKALTARAALNHQYKLKELEEAEKLVFGGE